MSASPMRPAPRIAIFRSSITAQSLGAHRALVAACHELEARVRAAAQGADGAGSVEARSGDEAAGEAGEEEDAGEALPLAVGSKELCCLGGVGPPSAQRGEQLPQPEVADEPDVVAAEPVERDDADAPRADPSDPGQPTLDDRRLHSAQRLEVDLPHEPSERGGARGSEAAGAEPCWGERGEGALARGILSAGADDGPLDRARSARLDELPGDGAERGLRDRRRAERPQPAEESSWGAEEAILREPPVELCRVVVEREEEARLLQRALVARVDEDLAGRELCRQRTGPVRQHRPPHLGPGAQAEGVGALWSDPRLDHGGTVPGSDLDTSGVGLVDAVSLRSRRRKLQLFLDELRPAPETTVLDVGADELAFGEGEGCRTLNFFEELYPWPQQITALGLHDGVAFRERYPAVAYVQGNALDLPFPDGSFDIVFSNAVLEHVGGREEQRRFVAEALRVGRAVFLTTPNRLFPLEVHTRLPLVHWMPDRLSHPIYRTLGLEHATELHLLTPRALRELFPGRVRIVNLGLTLVAIA